MMMFKSILFWVMCAFMVYPAWAAFRVEVLGINPAGGTIGQVLTKNSSVDYDYSWQAGGGGAGLSDWYINTRINANGGNASLTLNQNTDPYAFMVDVDNRGLRTQPISGSAAVGIACSGTNAAASPSTSTTTCSAGDEGLGISFDLDAGPGIYEACAQLTVGAGIDNNAEVFGVKWVETAADAQTIIQDTYSIQKALFQTISNNDRIFTPMRVCGIFNWSAKSLGDNVTIRLFYKSIGGGYFLQQQADGGADEEVVFTVKQIAAAP